MGPPPDEPEEPGLSPLEVLRFALGAARRQAVLAVSTAAAVGLVGISVVACIPPVYDATCKIFIQDSGGLTSVLASGHEHFHPLQGAKALDEFILAKDNLLAIVREARLVDTWPRTRALPMRIKDKIMAALVGPPRREDMERGLVEMLALTVRAAKDGESVRINGQWRDPQNAYDITRLVQRNFLSARAAYDLGPIQRAIPFLEMELAAADREVELAVARIQGPIAGAEETEDAGVKAADAGTVAERVEPQPGGELVSISRELSETRRKLRELVEPARQRVAELKIELIELQASYSPDHPKVLQQQAKIAAAQGSSAEVDRLKERESELLAQIAARASSAKPQSARPTGSTTAPASSRALEYAEAASSAPAQARLASALRKSDDIMARLTNARIELATAEMDFQHRYVTVEKPEVPGKPLKSKQPMLYAVSVIVALLLGIAAAALRELRRGNIVEPWQVRTLGIELLGQVTLKRLPPGKGS